MRIKRLKRRSKFFFLKIFIPFLVFFLIIFFLLLNISSLPFFNKPIISPLAKYRKPENNKIEALLLKFKIPFSGVLISSDSAYIINLSDGGTVFLSSNKDLEYQINSLQLMLSRLTIEGKRIKNLDFRFDKPVIKL